MTTIAAQAEELARAINAKVFRLKDGASIFDVDGATQICIAALTAAAASPEGMVMVPIDPYNQMREAFSIELEKAFFRSESKCERFKSAYKAMLAAAEAPQEGE